MLSRSSLTLAGFFAAGVLAVVGYSLVHRVESAPENTPAPLVDSSQAMNNAPDPTQDAALDPPSPEPAQVAPAPEPTGVGKWMADVTSEDAKARANAITALARAPKDEALPVLKRVLTGGEPEVDRPLALASLQTLALEQGDDDGRIKDVLRQTVSHADSETLAEAAQRTLDTIP